MSNMILIKQTADKTEKQTTAFPPCRWSPAALVVSQQSKRWPEPIPHLDQALGGQHPAAHQQLRRLDLAGRQPPLLSRTGPDRAAVDLPG